MTLEEIETFLAVVEQGNISAAAQYLFVTQGTVSNRIKSLEDELNAKLLFRQKGQKNIDLTPFGREFIPIAQQWTALWKDTQLLHQSAQRRHLRIGSIDVINNYTFLPLYQDFIRKYPKIQLSINTFHSNEIHYLMEKRLIDMRFVFSQVHAPNIISIPIYREIMYVVCHKDSHYHEDLTPDELPPEKEIFLRWGADYEIWHDSFWPGRKFKLEVNTGSMLSGYLSEPGYWGVAPMSLVAMLRRHYPVAFYRLGTPPPPRICYQITHQFPRASLQESLECFSEEVKRFVNRNDTICTFEPWMMETGK